MNGSSTAGHGNFFKESYTAIMDEAVSPVLTSIGLDWVAKLYAMGGMFNVLCTQC